MERHGGGFAVDFAGGRDEDAAPAELVGELQDAACAGDVGLDRADRIVDDELDADRRGQMVNDVCFFDEPGERAGGDHVALHELDAFLMREELEVINRASGEVVDDGDGVSVLQPRFGEMGTDESGSARDEDVHDLRSPSSFASPGCSGTSGCVCFTNPIFSAK